MIFLSVKQIFVWVTIIPRHCIVSQTDSFPSFSESIFLTDNSSMWNRFFCLSDKHTWTFFYMREVRFLSRKFCPWGRFALGTFVPRTFCHENISGRFACVSFFLHFPSRTNPAQMWRALFGLATGIQTSSTTCMEPRYMSTGWCLKQLLYWFLMLLCALWSFSVFFELADGSCIKFVFFCIWLYFFTKAYWKVLQLLFLQLKGLFKVFWRCIFPI